MTDNYHRKQLENFLLETNADALKAEFATDWLNDIIPGLKLLINCNQGELRHLEGDVAVHTALVFDNLLTTARARLGREADFIERFATLLHDFKKPQTRKVHEDGDVSFPGHEELATREVAGIAYGLELTNDELDKLLFLVAKHGEAHSWETLSDEEKVFLKSCPWIESLALLQEADAKSCILADGSHLPVYWDEMLSTSK